MYRVIFSLYFSHTKIDEIKPPLNESNNGVACELLAAPPSGHGSGAEISLTENLRCALQCVIIALLHSLTTGRDANH